MESPTFLKGTDDALATPTPYAYTRPCDHEYFRVVIIEPGNWGDAIKCSLVRRRIDRPSQGGPYKALSYVWGAPCITESIHLGDCQVEVTLKLFCVLRHLRHPSHSVIFWIDALVSWSQYNQIAAPDHGFLN